MIALHRIDVVATRRLQADGDVADAIGRDRETATIKFTCQIKWVFFGRAPTVADIILNRFRQAPEPDLIICKRQALRNFASGQRLKIIGRPGFEPANDLGTICRHVVDSVSGFCQRLQHFDRAGGGIQANTVAEPGVFVWIIGEDQADAAITCWCVS